MHPELFTTGFFIVNFGLRRGPRSGATTEAANNNVDTAYIKLINCSRKKQAERGTEEVISMQQVYTQVFRYVVTSLRFSQINSVNRGSYLNDYFSNNSQMHSLIIHSEVTIVEVVSEPSVLSVTSAAHLQDDLSSRTSFAVNHTQMYSPCDLLCFE